MIKGIGIDIVEIARIKSAVEKYGENFLQKIYTKHEIKYCRIKKALKYPELAVRFAAKEAYAKALGTGIGARLKNRREIFWNDIEIRNDALGKPQIYVKGKILKATEVSLSHSHDSAVAVVVIG